jgi:hypothetical protein
MPGVRGRSRRMPRASFWDTSGERRGADLPGLKSLRRAGSGTGKTVTVVPLFPSSRRYHRGVAPTGEWVMLAFRLPREPSTPRVTVWRKLRRLGVVQLLDGLVALPRYARTQEQLEWIADEVIEAGGEASIWFGRSGSAFQARALAARMAEAAAEEYAALIADAEAALHDEPATRRRTLARLRRELGRIAQRDHFPPPAAERAKWAIDRLAAAAEVPAS